MNKCLVTKHNGISSNLDLLKYGELRIKVIKNTTATSKKSITFKFAKDTNVSAVGGYIDTNLDFSNKRTNILCPANSDITVYLDNADYYLSISDKYSLEKIYDGAMSTNSSIYPSISVDLSSFKYSYSLKIIMLIGKHITGDISNLKNLTSLTQLYMSSTGITGDISNLKNLTSLTQLNMSSTGITGDISNLKNLTSLTVFMVRDTNVMGSISVLLNMRNLESCQLNKVSGDILSINNTKLKNLIISNSEGLSGDLALLNKDFKFLGIDTDITSKFSWSSRDTNAVITAISGKTIMSTNLDTVLNNMANCVNGLTSSSATWEKGISFAGTRTSASDEAVEKLTGYGYRIRIDKV